MNLGLKGKIKEIHKSVEAYRKGVVKPSEDLFGKRDVSLVEYLSKKYPEGNGKDGVFDIQHLYSELNINPNKMTVEALIDLDQDSRWLVPEIFRDAIRRGIRTAPFYSRITALSLDVAQPQVNMPQIDMSDADAEATAEAETISTGSITYDNKVVNVNKRGIGIDITYEAIQYTSINLLSIYLQDVGVRLGQRLNNDAISILINGDQDDASEAAATIGINNTVTGLLYQDLLYAWIRASRLGRSYANIIAGETVANSILNLQEFKEKQAGTPQQNIVVNETLPSQSQMFVSAQVPADQMIMLDNASALVQLTSSPLLVESEKLVKKQMEGTYATITTGFANIFRDARVIVDRSLALTVGGANDFPAWMQSTL